MRVCVRMAHSHMRVCAHTLHIACVCVCVQYVCPDSRKHSCVREVLEESSRMEHIDSMVPLSTSDGVVSMETSDKSGFVWEL